MRGPEAGGPAGTIRLFALVSAVALLAAACGTPSATATPVASASAPTASGPVGSGPAPTVASSSAANCKDTLTTAFYADMGTPDPDVFYATEGLQVTLAAYEGLLQYDPTDSNVIGAKIVGLLAQSWDASPDGLTYTFHLRSGLTFADGSPVTSKEVLYSFKRRTNVNQGPAYMLAQVASYDTPDPATFVVHLKQPVSAFLDFMASPYGPKLVNPAIVDAHQTNGDFGQGYLATHSAGTGPYQIDEFQTNTEYTLVRNDHYWGSKPAFSKVTIKILPDSTTQQIQLQAGTLDVVHNFPPSELATFSGKAGFSIIKVPSLLKQDIKVNPNKPPFDRLDLRQALRTAIDRTKLVPAAWGDTATPSNQMLPISMLPAGQGTDVWDVNPATLTSLVASLPAASKQVTIVYQVGAVSDQQMAEAIQALLLNAGFDAIVSGVPISDTFNYRGAPEASVPNMVVESDTPDAAAPETFGGIYYRTDAFLNFLKGGSAAADSLMNQGLEATDPAQITADYGKAMDEVYKTATFITLADEQYTFIARTGLSGYTENAAAPTQLGLAAAAYCP